MTDRKLLELAAKAAEIRICGWASFGTIEKDDWVSASVMTNGELQSWNPLKDDGDALRLAVRLNMDVDVDRRDITVLWADDDGNVYQVKEHGEKSGGDPLFATRRAIVRAAAEIGKAMLPAPTNTLKE